MADNWAKKARKATGLSQDAFAVATRTSVSTLRKHEQNVQVPTGGQVIFYRLIVKFPNEMLKLISELPREGGET